VPVTVATFQDFISVFGNSDGEKFGPIAMREWLRNAGAGTYVRVLGAGDGTARKSTGDNAGRVNNSGFVVGDRLPQANGLLGNNEKAGAITTPGTGATATLLVTDAGGIGDGETFVLVNSAGVSTTYRFNAGVAHGSQPGGAAGDTIQLGFSGAGGGVSGKVNIAAAIVASIAATTGADFTAVSDGTDTVTVTQSTVGAAGDRNSTDGVTGLTVGNFSGGDDGNSILGRTHMLVTLMSESAGSTVFSEAGIQQSGDNVAHPILRGVLMAPSGVVLGLSSTLEPNNAVAANQAASTIFTASENAGSPIGSINTSTNQFVMLVNGLKKSNQYNNVLTASMDPTAPNYFVNVFNTDPKKIQDAGHYLYTHYDISTALAVVTGTNVIADLGDDARVGSNLEEAVMLLTGSQARNSGTATTAVKVGTPNFENWEDRFSPAFSPFIVSQKFGARNTNLFRFHTLSDGAIGSGEFKITIENVRASSKAGNKYGTFDVLVRRFLDNDLNPQVVESFRGCSLDLTSDNYIAKRVGDRNTFFDFDAASGAQKVVVEGDYPNVSNFVRVQISPELKNGAVDSTALPTGFRGIHHLVTSGTSDTTSILTGFYSTQALTTEVGITGEELARVVQPPIPMRETLGIGLSPRKNVKVDFTWGIQFENKTSITKPNANEKIDSSLLSFAKWFPNFQTVSENPWVGDNEGTADVAGSVLDADKFNNNFFTLERVEVITGSNDRPNPQQWSAAKYQRSGLAATTLTDRDGTAGVGSRFLDPAKDFSHVPTQKYLKFTLPMIGGWDGVNVFNHDKSKLSDAAVRREMTDTSQGGKSGPTVAAYRKAMDLMEAKQDVDVQLLAIPGIRHPAVTDYAMEATERRFDALFLMDVEEKDEVDTYVTSSLQTPNVANTINRFAGRALDSSFAAAYYPDIVVADPATRTNVKAPATAVVLGAFSLNDSLAHPWFAPAGFTRGVLPSAIYPGVELLQQNRDDLYTADINPIIGDVTASGGVTVFGQKTLLAAQSALDRVNVRRLLIDVRRRVRDVARTFLFEPNQAATIAAFQARVQPILADVQSQGGLDRFRVIIDTTTTTQADIENNTIRGRIFLQPTRSVEFVSLDFVVSNSI
jgi:phage tail sheath protein FI